MSLEDGVRYLRAKNVVISADCGELVVRAPQGVVDSKIRALLKLYKQEFLTLFPL